MEKNHYKITEHVKKYNRAYLLYYLAYIVVALLALLLDAPTLLIPLLILIIIHIITKCVDVAEMDYLKNKDWSENAVKVFISGKITGEPIDECFYKFNEVWWYIAGLQKEDQIIEVINPLWLEGIHFGISHKEAMEICFEALKDCSHIYMLKDWKESKGAMMEHQFALDNGIKIIYQ